MFTHTVSFEIHNSYTNAVIFTYSQCPHTYSHVHTHIYMHTLTFKIKCSHILIHAHTFTLCDLHLHTYYAPTFRHRHTLYLSSLRRTRMGYIRIFSLNFPVWAGKGPYQYYLIYYFSCIYLCFSSKGLQGFSPQNKNFKVILIVHIGILHIKFT